MTLLTVGGCAVLLGVVPLLAYRSEGAVIEQGRGFEIAVPDEPFATTTAEVEIMTTTAGPGALLEDSVGSVTGFGSTSEVVQTLNTGVVNVFAITVQEPVDIAERLLAAGGLDSEPDGGTVVVGIPVTVVLVESSTDPLPMSGVFEWTIIGGATGTSHQAGEPGVDSPSCEALDTDLTAVDELSLGVEQRGMVCVELAIDDLGHSDTNVVLSVAKGAAAVWIR